MHGWTRRRKTTVAQTLMRGLATAGPWFVSGLPLSQPTRMPKGSLNQIEGCPDRPPRPAVHSVLRGSGALLAGCGESDDAQAVASSGGITVTAIAQAKAASSRAMATVTILAGLPARCSRR